MFFLLALVGGGFAARVTYPSSVWRELMMMMRSFCTWSPAPGLDEVLDIFCLGDGFMVVIDSIIPNVSSAQIDSCPL